MVDTLSLSLSQTEITPAKRKEKEERRKTAANGPKNVLTQSTIVITLQTKLSAPFCWLSSLSFSTIYSRLLLLLQLFSIAFFRCQIAHLLSLRPSGGNLLFITRQMASILMFFSLSFWLHCSIVLLWQSCVLATCAQFLRQNFLSFSFNSQSVCVYLCILPDSHSFSQFHWSVCVSTIPHRQTDSHTLYNERVFAILSSYYHTTTLLQLEQQQTDRRKLSVSLPSLLHFTFLAAAVTLLFHLSINLIQFNFTFQWANRQTVVF